MVSWLRNIWRSAHCPPGGEPATDWRFRVMIGESGSAAGQLAEGDLDGERLAAAGPPGVTATTPNPEPPTMPAIPARRARCASFMC